MKKTNKLDIKTITLMAMLTAISIILTRFLSIDILNKTTRIGFGSTPIIFSGVFLGPVAGGIVGALSDLLGMFIAPSGPYHPGLTVSSALTGIIPGLIAYFMPKKSDWFKNIASNAAVCIIVFFVINTLWITQLTGKAFIVLLPNRVISSVIITVVNIFIMKILMEISSRYN